MCVCVQGRNDEDLHKARFGTSQGERSQDPPTIQSFQAANCQAAGISSTLASLCELAISRYYDKHLLVRSPPELRQKRQQ